MLKVFPLVLVIVCFASCSGSNVSANYSKVSVAQKNKLIHVMQQDLISAQYKAKTANFIAKLCMFPGIVALGCISASLFLKSGSIDITKAIGVSFFSAYASFASWILILTFPFIKNEDEMRKEVKDLGLENEPELQVYLK